MSTHQLTDQDIALLRKAILLDMVTPLTTTEKLNVRGWHPGTEADIKKRPYRLHLNWHHLTNKEADLLEDWFAREPERWIEWTDTAERDDTHRPDSPGYAADAWKRETLEYDGEAWKRSPSTWRLVPQRLTYEVQLAAWLCVKAEYARQLCEADATRFPTLDEWLAADIRGDLEYPGDDGGDEIVRENDMHAHNKFIWTHIRRVGRRRICMCGAVFYQRKHNHGNCPGCQNLTAAQRKKRQDQRAGIDEHYPFEPVRKKTRDAG